MIQIQVPATSANIGSGFDSLGIALTLYNTVWMEEANGVEIISRDGLPIPTDKTNLVYWAAERLYEKCGKMLPGLHIEQQSDIPMTRGLGSSSACIVAGLFGANRLLGSPYTVKELVNFASELEGHPDNTTPAFLGGLVTSAVEGGRVYSVSVPVSERIRFAVLIPPFELKTEVARAVLPETVSREDAVYNLSRSALMTSSLFSGALENLRVAVQDRLHQQYRAHFIPGLEQVFRICNELGSYGTYISGAGPTVIAIIDREQQDVFLEHIQPKLSEKDIEGWRLELLEPDNTGVSLKL